MQTQCTHTVVTR